MSRRALRSYEDTAIDTLPPALLLDALYQRLLTDLDDAKAKILAGDAGGKGVALNHAHQITTVLLGALDGGVAPELCGQLAALYDFALHRIMKANTTMTVQPIDEARHVLRELKDAFAQVANQPSMTATER